MATAKKKTRNCPRCGTAFDENLGALSRVDNKTLVCSSCGTTEAFEDVQSREEWIDAAGGEPHSSEVN